MNYSSNELSFLLRTSELPFQKYTIYFLSYILKKSVKNNFKSTQNYFCQCYNKLLKTVLLRNKSITIQILIQYVIYSFQELVI